MGQALLAPRMAEPRHAENNAPSAQLKKKRNSCQHSHHINSKRDCLPIMERINSVEFVRVNFKEDGMGLGKAANICILESGTFCTTNYVGDG